MEPLNFCNGTYIPKDTFMAIAAVLILLDPDVVSDSQRLDASRIYGKRLGPGERERYQYAVVDRDHMHFGHGRYACSGRALTVSELRLILGTFLMKYDLKYPEGKGRPANKTVDEIAFADPKDTVVIGKGDKRP